MRLLNELWGLAMNARTIIALCERVGWKHTPAGRKQRVYDNPRTPYARLLAANVLDERATQKLAAEHEKLNPA